MLHKRIVRMCSTEGSVTHAEHYDISGFERLELLTYSEILNHW